MDNIKVTGALEILLKDSEGNEKHKVYVPNLVVTVGKTFIANRMIGTASNVMSHMAVGTSSIIPAAANTALSTELARVVLASSNNVNNVVTYSAVFPAGTGTGAIVEAGIFNAASEGILLCRTTFDVVNKGSSDSLSINWNITLN
jgi:hypothetical protein